MPDRLRGDSDPAAVERRHRKTEPVTLLSDQPVFIDDRVESDVVRHRRVEPELLLGASDLDVTAVDDERGHAARRLRRRVGAREQQDRAAERRVRDPLLRSAHVPAALDPFGARGHRTRVRSGPGLRQREAPDPIAASERRHEPRDLLLGAELKNRQRARRRVDGDRHPDARVPAGELLEHEDVRQEVRTCPAVRLRDADPQQPELREPGEQLAGKAVVAVPLGGVRLDLRTRELAGE